MKKHLGKILLLVLPILISLIVLYPTYNASQLEKTYKDYVTRAEKAGSSADSMAIMTEFDKKFGVNYKSAKNSRLKLGLDLRGGMYVTLEADFIRLISETADQSQIDDTFNEVLDKTKKDVVGRDVDVVEVFSQNFDQIARVKGKKLKNYFDIGGDKADVEKHEKAIVDHLKGLETQAIDQALEVIRQRIDKYGVSEPTIQKQGNRRVMLELPGVTNEAEMLELLQTTAKLEFKLLKNDANIAKAFDKIDKHLLKQSMLKKGMPVEAVADSTIAQADSTATPVVDSTKTTETAAANVADSTKPADTATAAKAKTEVKKTERPFTSLFNSAFTQDSKKQRTQPFDYDNGQFPEGEYYFNVSKDSLKYVMEILNRRDVKELIPPSIQIARSAKSEMNTRTKQDLGIYEIYAIKKENELKKGRVINAQATYDQTSNQPVVTMQMDDEGSQEWGKITGDNIGKRVAIVLDDQVYSAPTVQNKIMGGSSQITGMANEEEAKLLKIVLKSGALTAPVNIEEKLVVGPSLGEDSIRSGLIASFIAFALVVLFMILYYGIGGVVADIAVLLNVLLIIATLAAFKGTLSLPGIAGIILTIGMAVDANVLIYERIREELHKGRSLKSSVDEGFAKALSAIIDSNVTTFITGLILYFFGTGAIQGFALTLMIGIIFTLFTAIMCSRAMIEMMMARGMNVSFGQPKNVNA